MLLAILSICSQEELVDNDEGSRMEEDVTEEVAARRQQIKNKILAVGRMQRVFQLLRCARVLFGSFVVPGDINRVS